MIETALVADVRVYIVVLGVDFEFITWTGHTNRNHPVPTQIPTENAEWFRSIHMKHFYLGRWGRSGSKFGFTHSKIDGELESDFGLVGSVRVRELRAASQFFELGLVTRDCGQPELIWLQIRILRKILGHVGFPPVKFGHFGASCTLPAIPVRYCTVQKYQQPKLGAQIA